MSGVLRLANYEILGGSIWILVAALLFAVAGVLAFAPRATPGRRILALYLAIIGFQDLAAIPFLLGMTPDSPLRVAAGIWQRDLRFVAHLALAAFLWRYPARAKWRSLDGAIQIGGTVFLLVATGIWIFARSLLSTPPYQPGGIGTQPTLIGILFSPLQSGVTIVLGMMLISAFLRSRDLPLADRRTAALVIPALVPWAIYWAAGIYPWTVMWALGSSGPFLPGPGTIPGDLFPVGSLLHFTVWFVLPPTFAILWWRRERSTLPLVLIAFGVVHSLIMRWTSLDFWVIQHAFIAIVPAYAAARHGGFGGEIWRGWPSHLVIGWTGVVTFLTITTVTLDLSKSEPFFLSVGILTGLVAGAAVSFALVSRERAVALGLGRAGGAEETAGRFAPYRAALADAMEHGASSEDTSRRLRALRTTLGVSEREHAALEYALRAPATSNGAPAPARSFPAGSLFLGRYRILRVLGEGGAGTTRLCRDETVGRDVVLKTLRASHPSPEGLASLLREARAIAIVRHPNVATLYDVEQVGDEAVLVMEHAEAGSLRERLARGPLDRSEFLVVARGLLDALEAVHAASVVHRDIKPSNVLLTAKGEPKLADFGVAHVSGFETTAGSIPAERAVGTVRYMSPEQARGRRVTARSDLYSAAATLYEAWTGEALLDVRRGESAVEVQMRAASAGAFEGHLDGPPALRAWFAQALDPAARERFASAREMRIALEAAL